MRHPVYMREGKIPCGNIPLPFPWFCRFHGRTPWARCFPGGPARHIFSRDGVSFSPSARLFLFSPLVPRKNSGPVLICVYFFALLMPSVRRENGAVCQNVFFRNYPALYTFCIKKSSPAHAAGKDIVILPKNHAQIPDSRSIAVRRLPGSRTKRRFPQRC